MRRMLIALGLIGCVSPLEADVILPETGRLAGPLDSTVSAFGDEFINIPEFLQPRPAAAGTMLNGWVEIRFAPPEGDTAEFVFTFGGAGTSHEIEFGGGQVYEFFGNRITPRPPENSGTGVVNLETGEIERIEVITRVAATSPVRINKINRMPFAFLAFFPPPDLGAPLPPFPPDFIFNDASFTFDSDGRIRGFQFFGKTIVPAGLVALFNEQIELFPRFAFGPEGKVYFANPDTCRPGTLPEDCPTDEENPDGILLSPEAILHPFFLLRSDELREVPPAPAVPPCVPAGLSRGAVLAAAGGKLYFLGGVSASGRPTRQVWVHEPAADRWRPGPPLGMPVTDAQGAAIGTRIYVVGGRRQPRGPATGTLQVLDTESGRWSEMTPAPIPVARAATAVVGDLLYVLGGVTNRPSGSPAGNLRFSHVIQAYDPATDVWLVFPARIGDRPVQLEAPGAVASGSDIYLVGGLTADDRTSGETLIFDTFTQTFQAGPEMLWGTYEAAVGIVDTRIFVAGGRRTAGGPSDLGMQIFEIDRGVWLEGKEAPMPTAMGAAATANGRLYLVGGRIQAGLDGYPGTATRSTQVYDPAQGWHLCPSQPFFTSAGVMNTAGLSVGPRVLAPGSQASVVGYNFAPPAFVAPDEPVAPTELAGIRVTVDGRPAPILGVSPNRIDFQVPFGVPAGGTAALEVVNAATPFQAPAVRIPIAGASPGIFIQSCGEVFSEPYLDESSAIACNANGTLNYAANAAPPGTVLTLQMTGLGPVDRPLMDGERGPTQAIPSALSMPAVTVRGEDGEPIAAEVISATLAPGEIGVFDVRIRLPGDSRTGNRVRVVASVDGVESNRAVISVGQPTTNRPLPCLRDSMPEFRLCFPPGGPF